MRRMLSSWNSTFTKLGFRAGKQTRRVRGNNRRTKLGLESLEDRRMLAAVTVDTSIDELNGDTSSVASLIASPGGDGISLREALAVSLNVADDYTIDFHSSLDGATIQLNQGQLELIVGHSVTIDASMLGSGLTIQADDPNSGIEGDGARVMSVSTLDDTFLPATVEIDGLTLTGGDVDGSGGGLFVDFSSNPNSHLTLRETEVLDNFATLGGGGVYMVKDGSALIQSSRIANNKTTGSGGGFNAGPAGGISFLDIHLIVEDSTFDNNEAVNGSGGGLIMNTTDGTPELVVRRSTFSDNSAGNSGGGVYLCSKTGAYAMHSINSTFSGNTATGSSGEGGGIFIGTSGINAIGSIDMTNTTVANNRSENGAGVFLEQVSITGINNSIIANNYEDIAQLLPNNIEKNNSPTITAKHNLIGKGPNGGILDSQTSGDGFNNQVGKTEAEVGLASLSNNAGPTETHALMIGSLALDAGDDSLAIDTTTQLALTTDQRGWDRYLDSVQTAQVGTVDIGAYEFLVDGGVDPVPGGPQITDVIVSGSDSLHSTPIYSYTQSGDPQLLAIPFGGVDTITITFNEPVTTSTDPHASDLTLVSLGESFNPVEPIVESIAYSGSSTVTWKFTETFGADQYNLIISDSLTDIVGQALDGNGSPDPGNVSLPSGDGSVGGVFVFTIAAAPDFNRDGIVDLFDFEPIRVNFGQTTLSTFSEGDFNGDGMVDFADFRAWKNYYKVPVSAGIAALEADIVVSTLADEMDGDYSYGDLSLREALFMAGEVDGADSIAYDMNLFSTGTQWDFSSGYLIDSDVTIQGPGADLLTIGNAWTDRIFTVSPGVIAEISGVTIAEGYATEGGLIRNEGNLTLSSVELTDGSAADGGAVWSSGNLTILDSLVRLNGVNNGYGGAIYNQAGTFSAYNSTFSDNYHSGYGSGIAVLIDGGTGELVNVTVTGNTAFDADYAAAIDAYSYVEVDNSIIAGNTNAGSVSSPDINFATSASSNNLIGIIAGTTFNGTNLTGDFTSPLDARLDTLRDNGGPTRTYALLADSPAINQGDTALATGLGLTNDQRGDGFDRVRGGAVDMGSYEATLVVTSTADVDNGNYDLNDLSLREAVALAANTPGSDDITFGSVSGWISVYDVTIDSDVSVIGPGDDSVHLSGDFNNRIFSIDPGVVVEVRDIVLTDGDANQSDPNGGLIHNEGDLTVVNATLKIGHADQHGGAIYSTGDLTVSESNLSGNFASSTGGAIYQSGGLLAIDKSTIDGNQATFAGGGVVAANVATVDIISSTISRNEASYVGGIWMSNSNGNISNSTISTNTANSGFGGGAYLSGSGNTVTFTNATIANNSAGSGTGGGLYVFGSNSSIDVTLNNTIVAGNTNTSGVDDVFGAFSAASAYSLIGVIDGSTGLTSSGTNLTGTSTSVQAAGLGALANNGGPTETHALLTGSDAIDAGDDALAIAFGLLGDQRGEDREQDGDGDTDARVDIGAFELAFS